MTDDFDHFPLIGPDLARPEDCQAVVDLLDLVFRIAAGREPTIGADISYIYYPANMHNVLVIRLGERIIASTGIWTNDVSFGDVRLRVGGISTVAVHPNYRKHGLGTQVMAAAQRQLRQLGCQVGLLHTGIDNWYRSMGWERAASGRLYRLDLGNLHLLPDLADGVSARSVGDPDGGDDTIAAILRLHHAGRLGGLRMPTDFRQLLRAKKYARILLAEKGGQALAYLLARDSMVVEWGGAAELLPGLVKAFYYDVDEPTVSRSQRDSAFKILRLQSISLVTPNQKHPFVNMLDCLRIPFSLDYLGMMYVLDPTGILRAYGHNDLSVAENKGAFTVGDGQTSTIVSRSQLAKLFFGPERVSDVAPDIFPLPFWQWPLERT
jgi:GNAT superfamily N-acetyltransferase